MGFFRRDKAERLAGLAIVREPWLRNRDGSHGNCKMQLELDVPGVPPQRVKHHELMMSANRWPEEGMRVAVTVDPDDHEDVDVDWDSVFGEMRGGLLGHVAEQAALVAGIDVDLSKGTPPDPDAPPALPADQIPARVAELNAQFARGEITYEQMSAEIMKAMGSV